MFDFAKMEKRPEEIFAEHNVIELKQVGEHVAVPHTEREKFCKCDNCAPMVDDFLEAVKGAKEDEIAALKKRLAQLEKERE